jgi:Sortilin, neurotensin receptor 3,
VSRSVHPVRTSLLTILALGAITSANAQQRGGQPQRAPAQNPVRFQMMGPASGGRVAAIVGVPGDARVWYAGNASGGVWKSTDSGSTFVPVFDAQPVQAIGALAISQSNPAQVWAGTGEAWAIRDADVMGDGVYLSTDSGTTWTNMGLRETGRIGRIIVHPRDPQIVYVCALGRATGRQDERGVFRTRDGGKSWQRVLFVDPNTGCSGLALDAKNPSVLFAGMWQVEMHTWAMFSGGPSSALYTSRDGGSTWTKVVHPGLPKSPVGKIDVAIAPTDSKRVYALIQTADQGSLWRSDDGGASWRVVNWTRALVGRAGYYIRLGVSTGNKDEVLVANSSFFRSTDGGKTFEDVPWGGDNHDIWYDPKNPNRFGLTNDADLRITTNHGRSFTNTPLPNGQMYHVAVDNQIPYWIYGNRQDNGTMRGPSTAPEAAGRGRGGGAQAGRGRGGRGGDTTGVRRDSTGRGAGRGVIVAGARRDSAGRGAPAGGVRLASVDSAGRDSLAQGGGGGGGGGGGSTWDHGLGGCESGFTLPDQTDASIVWASCYGNTVTRWNAKTKSARSVSPWIHTLDSPPNELKYRCHWTPPLAIDPFDHNTVYYGCQVVFRTSNAGQSWSVISPDLSTRDSSRIVSSGGIVGDNLGQFYGEVVFAIAPSEIQQGLIWAGTNDGQLWYTSDAGVAWTNVSKNIGGLPPWGTIRKIEPSHFDPATAYVAVDFHMMDDRKPFLYKTSDFGKTWRNITGDLPADHPLDYTLAIAENPNRKGMLFAGTGHGFYYSLDDGTHWAQYKEGLPAAPVTWIVVPKLWHDVVVSTYGRGLYILKDITPLEEGSELASNEAARLYPPHPGYRQARSGRADITFSLKAATSRPIRLEIADSAGATIRTMQVPTRAGFNRAIWDLRYDAPRRVELRTTPVDNPHIWDEPRFRARNTRPITHWGIQAPQNTGPIATPGRYTARFSLDGKTYAQTFSVLKDPEILSSDADLVASSQTQVRVRDDMNAAVEMINKLEVMRRQIEDQRRANADKPDVVSALAALDKRMLDIELILVSRSDLNSDDKYYVEKYRVYMNLIWLAGEVGSGAGDVAGGAEYRPTDASLAVLAEIERDLAAAKAGFEKLIQEDVPAFNRAMGGKVAAIAER